jgi:hypothetical protein
MKLIIALAVTAAVMCSFPAHAADPAKCAANCKAYCDKSYPGVAACQGRCQTRNCR